jgi:hypothetical protein
MEKDELKVAMDLLEGKGLNHTAFTKDYLDQEIVDSIDKKKTKDAFDSAIALLTEEYGERIYKDGYDYFLRAETPRGDIDDLKDEVERLKGDLLAMTTERDNAQAESNMFEHKVEMLNNLIRNSKVEPEPELRKWRYNQETGEGKIFTVSEIENLDPEWKDRPKE